MTYIASTPNPDIARMIAAGNPGAYIQHDASSGQYHIYGQPLKPPLKKPNKPVVVAKPGKPKKSGMSRVIDKTIYIAAIFLTINIAFAKCHANTPSEPPSKPATSSPTTRK